MGADSLGNEGQETIPYDETISYDKTITFEDYSSVSVERLGNGELLGLFIRGCSNETSSVVCNP